jgi:putative PIN family toxin of toxin-antitoxin system
VPASDTVRLVVDTNVFVSAVISPKSPPATILRAIRIGHIQLLTSDDIVDEYLRVLGYPRIRKYKHITDEAVRDLAAFLINNTERIEVTSSISLSPDPDDNKFLEVALDGEAAAVITGDKVDLLKLKFIDKIPILTAADCVRHFHL